MNRSSLNLTLNADGPMIDPSTVLVLAIGYLLTIVVLMAGIPANLIVVCKMNSFKRRLPDQYVNGTGVCLTVMAFADLVSVLLLLLQYAIGVVALDLGQAFYSLYCKLVTFVVHVSTSVSIWSWLLMSTLRYLSVYWPFQYVQLWHLPKRSLRILILITLLTNLWLFFSVDYHGPGECFVIPHFSSTFLNRLPMQIEIMWSFCIPTVVILLMDASVLFRPSSASLVKPVSVKNVRKSQWLSKWLAVTFVCLVLNAPENLYRMGAAAILVDGFVSSTNTSIILRFGAQVMYFSQFSVNAIFLALFVYERKPNAVTRSVDLSLIDSRLRSVRGNTPTPRQYSSMGPKSPRKIVNGNGRMRSPMMRKLNHSISDCALNNNNGYFLNFPEETRSLAENSV